MPDIENHEQDDEQAKNEAGVEEDTNAETDQDQNPDGEQQEDSDSEDDENDSDGDEDSDDKGGDDELDLPRAKDKIAKANAEAKNLRARLRETEEKLKDAKTPEEVEEIVQQMTKDREAAEAALLRENVALKYKLPEALQKRLTGTTREEMEADAKELADLFGTDEDDDDLTLEGGLNPRDREADDPDDPRALAAKYGRRGKRR